MKNRKRDVALWLVAGVAFVGVSAKADIAIIAHPSNAETRLTVEEVKQLYLGRLTSLPQGGKAVLVDHKDGSATKEQFLAKVLNKTASELKAHWSRLIFSGGGVPPAVIGGDQDVKSWVARNPNGVGYIDRTVVDGTVKVLLTVP